MARRPHTARYAFAAQGLLQHEGCSHIEGLVQRGEVIGECHDDGVPGVPARCPRQEFLAPVNVVAVDNDRLDVGRFKRGQCGPRAGGDLDIEPSFRKRIAEND